MVIYHGKLFGEPIKVQAKNGVERVFYSKTNENVEAHEYWCKELDRKINGCRLQGSNEINVEDMWSNCICKVWLH